jgi:hypothetical protein
MQGRIFFDGIDRLDIDRRQKKGDQVEEERRMPKIGLESMDSGGCLNIDLQMVGCG